jgi:uncharacterized protein (DUF362 family)
MNRRDFIQTASLAGAGLLASSCQNQRLWDRQAYRKQRDSRVLIQRAQNYDNTLTEKILSGLKSFKLALAGKRVLLKPNLVEHEKETVINTNPIVIGAVIEACKQLGAREVMVAEGPGHRRDTDGLLISSGLWPILKDTTTSFVDLNLDDLGSTILSSHYMKINSLLFPKTIFNSDILISLPKLKTHHWAGMTLSMKNLFGIVPGMKYGWPKNFLHWHGIENCILDINSTIPAHFAIVDGIVAMEGNGPIQGTPKHLGVLVFGDDLVAVDSTCARLAGLRPEQIKYLSMASEFLGNLEESTIEQMGEPINSCRQSFKVIENFDHLKNPSLS